MDRVHITKETERQGRATHKEYNISTPPSLGLSFSRLSHALEAFGQHHEIFLKPQFSGDGS